MLRSIAAVVVGVIIGAIVIGIAEGAGHMVFPPPEGVDLKNPEEVKAIMHEIPVGAKVSVLIAWGLGIFVGGWLAMQISKRVNWTAWTVAGVLFALACITMVMIPHPIWMMIGAVLVTLVGGWGAIKASG